MNRFGSGLRWRVLLLLLLVCAPLAGLTLHLASEGRRQLVPDDVVALLGNVPRQALFAEVDRRLIGNLAALGIAACFAVVLGWSGSYLLVLRPVRTLVATSARSAKDEPGRPTGLARRGDELGQLARTCDQMAQALAHREEEGQSADHVLRASETRYRRLFETAHDGILILNADTGQSDDVTPFLTNLLGYTREPLLGNTLWDIGPFMDTKASKAEFRELQREDYVRHEHLPLESSTGKSINAEFGSNAYHLNGGRVIQCRSRDITEPKHAEATRQQYNRRLQVLSPRLVESQETDRRNIARELHDESGQALTVLQLNLQAMLRSPGADALAPRLHESLRVAERVLGQVHDISLSLRPSMLDDLGLVPTLVWLLQRQKQLAGLKGEVHADASEQRLDPVIETACFRVTQEALTNVVRHAQAKVVTVESRKEAAELHLRVRDDGIGCDVTASREQAVRGASLGLLSMEERAVLAGGQLEFNSGPARDTEVHAWFPLTWSSPTSASGAS